jgi:hypothetical protein
MAPEYPGITDSPTLDEWNPPFPVDLRRVRPMDEAYWRDYRTTPKAFIALEDGQRLLADALRRGHVDSRVPVGEGRPTLAGNAATTRGRPCASGSIRRRLGLAGARRAARVSAVLGAAPPTSSEYFTPTSASFSWCLRSLLAGCSLSQSASSSAFAKVGLAARGRLLALRQVRGVFLREGLGCWRSSGRAAGSPPMR